MNDMSDMIKSRTFGMRNNNLSTSTVLKAKAEKKASGGKTPDTTHIEELRAKRNKILDKLK